ncbi:hypothetical protein ACFTAO_01370 [Paenibacillus rhizoplanae]
MLLLMAVTGGLYLWRGGESLLLLLTAGGVVMSGGLLMQLCGPRRVNVQRTITPAHLSAGGRCSCGSGDFFLPPESRCPG